MSVRWLIIDKETRRYVSWANGPNPPKIQEYRELIDYRDHTDLEGPVPRELPEWLMEDVDAKWDGKELVQI